MADLTVTGATGLRPDLGAAKPDPIVAAVAAAVHGSGWLAALSPAPDEDRPKTAAALLAHPRAAGARAAGDLLGGLLDAHSGADPQARSAEAVGRGKGEAAYQQLQQIERAAAAEYGDLAPKMQPR